MGGVRIADDHMLLFPLENDSILHSARNHGAGTDGVFVYSIQERVKRIVSALSVSRRIFFSFKKTHANRIPGLHEFLSFPVKFLI